MDISVLIVNYNTAELVKKCIESVLSQRDVAVEVIVVDNNSRDNSVQVIEEFGAAVTLIMNQDNKGFGKANNQAFRVSTGRYLFLLNPDAHLLTEMDLHHAVEYMDKHTQYGLVGTRIVNHKHEVETTAWEYYPRQKKTSMDFSGLPGKWATVLGASMIVRRQVFEEVGGFDEDYFLYAEETDLCLRIRKQGYKIGYCEAVTVQHVGGASEKGNPCEDVVCKKRTGKYLFYRKHYPGADVVRLLKRDLRHARFHMVLLTLKKFLLGLSDRQEAKYMRHKVSSELAQQFLGSM